MPTKLNRAGEQQNYVPSGNGDASGEYGDHKTGSNIHFKQFVKPEDLKSNNGIVHKKYENFGEFLDKNFEDSGDSPKEDLIKKYEIGNKDSQQILLDAYNKKDVSISFSNSSYFSEKTNEIKIKNDANTPEYLLSGHKGVGFYHENFHFIDSCYGDNIDNWFSMSYKFEDGKTIAETLDEEYDNFNNNGSYDELKKIYNDGLDELAIKETGFDFYTLNNAYDIVKKETKRELKKALKGKVFEDELEKDLLELKIERKVMEKYNRALEYDVFELIGLESNYRKDFGDISDMCQASTGKDLCDIGHDEDYFTLDLSEYTGREGDNLGFRRKSREFFAECCSLLSIEDGKNALKTIEKYFPKSLGKVKQGYNLIKEGKVQMRGDK